MKEQWTKKVCAVLTASMLIATVPGVMGLRDNRMSESTPEEVYVDILGEGERSTLFNDNWKFNRGDVADAANTKYNDSSWGNVNLPHDYSIDQSFTISGEAESGFLPGGIGWYRKTFVVPEKYQDKQFMIEFDGAYMDTEVYLNGTKIGEHPYGYTAFAFDITDGLVCDGVTENVLAVKTDNKIPSSRWYSGSGIYRDVTLTVTDKVHVGYNGTQIIARDLETTKDSTVAVDVTTMIDNDSDTTKTVTVKNTLLNDKGAVASSIASNEVQVSSDASKDITQQVTIDSPRLWSVTDAYMYTMKTEILVGSTVVDTYETDYGFRYFAFSNNEGFSLNGENMKLKGVCMHHDQGALGAVANRDAMERQIKMLKDMGCNSIRVTHNPAASTFLDLCNEYGILVINEAFDGWTAYKNGNVNDYTTHFTQTISADNQILNGVPGMTWGEFDVKAMVDGGKNDPSIILWSLGNELDEGVGGASVAHYVDLAVNIIDWVKEVDTSRPVTIGDNRKGSSSVITAINQKIHDAGGVIGLNYARKDQITDQTQDMHSNNPDWKLYGSETASAVHSRGFYSSYGRDDNKLQMSEYDNDLSKVGWGDSASTAWSYVIENDFNAGEYVWTGFDYIGEPTPWNGTGAGSVSGQGAKPKSSYFGIIDTAGFEKDTYYLYKSLWDENSTTLHLMSTWNNDEIVKNDNGKVKVDVYTNAKKVELYLNDNKIGEDTATSHMTTLGYTYQTFSNGEYYPSFEVEWQSGTLSAKAYDADGNLISDTKGRSSVSTNTVATQLDAYANKSFIKADGSSLSYITVDVKDANGNVVAGANNRIHFNITGDGKIVGVDNGDATDTDSYKGNSRKAFYGKALVIVQSTKEAGSFTLTASSDGLNSSRVTVDTTRDANEGDVYLQSYKIAKNLYVGVGETPTLVNQVVGTYNNGDKKNLNITWDVYDTALLDEVGEFTITGKLQDSDSIVSVAIHVIGEIVAMESYATATNAGVAPSLPATVRGFYGNGSYSEEFPVVWNITDDTFKNEGIVIVKGTVSILNETKEVTAKVRVAPKLVDSKNIASKNYSDAPTFTNGKMEAGGPSIPSSTPINDSLAELNDGITSEGGRESARWTNWSLRNENPPIDTYLQLEWTQEYAMQNIKLWHFIDNSASALPGDDNVHFEYYDSTNNTWKDIESSHITQVPYTSGDTPYGFIHPITTSKLRVWLKAPAVGKCIGLTEIEVYDYISPVAINTTANLDELKLAGVKISDFAGYKGYDAATKTYTVELDNASIPEISAFGNNNEAISIVPTYNNETKIIVKSEDASKVETYTIKFNVPIDKDTLSTYVNSAEIKTVLNSSGLYTSSSYQEFKLAYDRAINILNDAHASQQQIDDCLSALEIAYQGLTKIAEQPVNKNTLESIIEKANKITDDDIKGAKQSDIDEFKNALKDAKAIFNDEHATQDKVDAAVTRLSKAINNLKVVEIDKTALQSLISKVEKLNKDEYTISSWDNLTKALINAKAILMDTSASASMVEEAEIMLQKAFNQLEKVNTNQTNQNNQTGNISTGDTTSFMPLLTLIISIAGIALVIKRKKNIKN